MKNFKINEDGLFVCEECNKVFHKKDKLSYHINLKHNGTKDYYDKYLKEEGEGLCKICNNETKFTGFKYTYDKCCCKNCQKVYRKIQTEKSVIKIYGVKNASESKDIKDKIKLSWSKKTKEDRYNIRKKIENTWSDKYGTSNIMLLPFIKEKVIKTNNIRYGFDYAIQNNNIKNKVKTSLQKTLYERYGVKNVSQVPEFFEKNQKNQLKLKQFRNTDINYQGSYELDFLNNFYDKFNDIKRGPTIKYILNNEKKVYHSDFLIPSLNLVIEIKNINLYKNDIQKITAKKKYTIENGYDYILILEKNYNEFLEFIKNK